ncbi:prepilin peptidase [Amycolatopsis sp. NPDC059090]|uniref:prepilin peptidase n=1 Tax=unclassified Amycolatopsis TaxID=2618356 RepID=UPI00366F816A
MVLTAVLAAGAVVPVLLVMMKKVDAPVSAVLGLTVAVAAAAVAAVRAETGALPAWWLPVAWLVSVLGVPLALADARHRRLPDILTLPAYPAVALTLTLAALSGGGWRLAAGAALGCLLFGGTHLIVHRLSAGGLGPGDVKLAGSFGAVLGAVGGLAPAVAAVLAAMVSLAALLPMWLLRRLRESRASVRWRSSRPGPSAPASVLFAGELHEPTPNQPDSTPQTTALAQPSTSTAAASVPTGVAVVGSEPTAPAQPSTPTAAASVPTGVAFLRTVRSPAPTVVASAPTAPAEPSTSTAAASVPINVTFLRTVRSPAPTVVGSESTAPGQPSTSTAAASVPTDATQLPTVRSPAPTAAAPMPTAPASPPDPTPASKAEAPSPPPAPARPRIRAGPLRVPYGPGLVLATWACAVFPAAGTGIA